MTIHCIGDSHANFFCGSDDMQPEWPGEGINNYIPIFSSYRIGPVLAYNLCRLGSTTLGREIMLELLGQLPAESDIMFCFGEIDCRAHIVLQAERQNQPAEDVVKAVVDRYFSVIKEVKEMGFNVLVWNVIPSAPTDINSRINVPPKYKFYGTCVQRNDVTRMFNRYLRQLSENQGIFFLDIFERLMNEDGSVKLEYYCKDDIHLSQKAMSFVLEELRENGDKNGINTDFSF